jgi:diketogulonate reductase-like aldo/keto reductase
MHVTEANGAKIPTVGFGTWQLSGDVAAHMVSEALKLGYRHVDTAAMYGNEVEVGEGMRASGVKREDVFLTTKVWQDNIGAGDLERSVEASLKKLKFPYVDLILIHWPNEKIPLSESIGALNNVKRAGLARHIGVSNFTVALIEEAVKLSAAPLITNQIELHPFIDGDKIIAACRKHGIAITAYCPVARGHAAGDKVLAAIGKAHGKSAAQVSLRYLVQQGIIVIPRTSKVEHLKANFDIFDFTLTSEEMAKVHALAHPGGRVVNFSLAPAWD